MKATIYTGVGDAGQTRLLGNIPVSKDDCELKFTAHWTKPLQPWALPARPPAFKTFASKSGSCRKN
jgi:hypothetical protein